VNKQLTAEFHQQVLTWVRGHRELKRVLTETTARSIIILVPTPSAEELGNTKIANG
jgi:hypothetical protein